MCEWGTYENCTVWICAKDSPSGEGFWANKPVDACLAPLINAFNDLGFLTRSCCCGHGKRPFSIVFHNGFELIGDLYPSAETMNESIVATTAIFSSAIKDQNTADWTAADWRLLLCNSVVGAGAGKDGSEE